MSTKPTGLAAFTGKKATPAAPLQAETPIIAEAFSGTRKRAQGETVALTVRVGRTDWARLHQLAVAEGVSLQALALLGLSKVFAEHGLPPIRHDVKAS
jgi:hypothetical protein